MTRPENTVFIRPSAGYLFTLTMGCAGLTFMALGTGGALIGRAGGDPIHALDVDGMVMFLLGFAILFSMRLIFWSRTPPGVRSMVRLLISAILVLDIPISILGLALAWQLPQTVHHSLLPLYFSVLAVLCQLASALWLTRYRHEGL